MKTICISLMSILIFLSSCSDWLDTEQKGVTPQDKFYQTDDEALAAVYAIYASLQEGEPFLFKNFMADDVNTGGGARGDNFGYEEINEFRHASNNGQIRNHFETYYRGIYLCNMAINRLVADSDIKKQVIAEAKALRAYYYMELVTLWGRVPLVLEELEPGSYAQPNAEIMEIWTQIEIDLKDAIPDLPLKSKQTVAERVRISQGAAQSLLGKAYLYQKKYDEAIVQFEDVIQSGEYNLYPDFASVFKKEQELGIESIFEISYVSDPANSNESETDFFACGPRDGFFNSGNLEMESGWGFMPPKKTLYDAFIDANDIIRRKATLLNEEELSEYNASIRSSSGALQYGGEGFLRMKYATWISERGDNQSLYGTNIRVIRYADVLLMAAEAYNRSHNALNKEQKALEYINLVRDRAELPPLSSNGDQLFEDIKKERRLELAFENVRFQDLIRWGDAADVLKNQGKKVPRGDGTFIEVVDAGFKDRNWFLPIPADEMNVNPNIEQNPGY